MSADAALGRPGAAGACIGIDVGGTFTDVVLFEPQDGHLLVAKVPSTPANQAEGVMAGLGGIERPLAALARIAHGTTVSTNTLLQRTGARVAVVTTAGFRDALEIGRTRRMLPSVYDPTFVRPPPLVPRPLRFEVAERVLPDGSVLEPLDEAAVVRAGEAALAAGAEALAVCFLNSYANPAHEARAAAILRDLAPDLPVTSSAEVVPEFREYERFSTAALNAYLLPAMERYLRALERSLAEGGCGRRLLTMSSGGGAMDLDSTCRLPVRTILSGPVGGVLGSLWIAEATGIRDFVTCDMGGTSTDVCLVEDGRPATVAEIAFAGYPIKGLQVSINTVGAGGGSIAFLEAGGLLKVGPRSAGADPGPACYGLGGREPTVTDAHVVLGRIAARRPLGGHIGIEPATAREAVAGLAGRVGVGITALAGGIVELSIARMASAIREITVERGHNPADFALVAFGGAGPMHASELARELGMHRVIVPVFPGNLSALGLLTADERHDLVRTFLRRLSSLDAGELAAALRALESEGRAQLGAHGFAPGEIRFEHVLDMRYARQAFEIPVPLPPGAPAAPALRDAFLASYERHFGHADAGAEIEVVNLRTTAIGRVAKPAPAPAPPGACRLADALLERRPVVFGRTPRECAVYERDALPLEVRFTGPAVIEEMGATTVVAPGWSARRDRFGNLHLTARRLTRKRRSPMLNLVRNKLDRHETVLGMMHFTGNPMLIEVMAAAGLDFAIIDLEHSPIDLGTAAHVVRAADAAGLTPLVRVPEVDAGLIKKMLNVGARGIVIPHADAAACEAAIAAAYFPPEGARGSCPAIRAARYSEPDWPAFTARANRDVLLIPLIEEREVFEDFERLAAMPELDVFFIGPFDLSISLGVPGARFDHPVMAAALERIVGLARARGKYVMTSVGEVIDTEYARTILAQGVQMISYSADALVFLDACRRIAQLKRA